jgi:transcriptional regulator with XRE-family HTH domain
MAVLLREAIGDRLRHARTNQRRTLREVSRAARVSLGYLSEVERGRKEASSELLAAICEALELPLSELLHNVASDVRAVDAVTVAAPAHPELGEAAGHLRVGSTMQTGGRMARAGAGMSLAGPLVDQAPEFAGEHRAELRVQPMLSHRLPTPIKPGPGVVVAA